MQQQLAHYQIRDLLGEGTFASVYRAFDEKFERDVALKVLKPVWLSDTQAVARFNQEAKTMAKLRHPHIVDVYDVGQAEGYIYLAQLLVTGETLAARLARGPLAWNEMLSVLESVASALDYAHGRDVIHRDVKPSNILLGQQGRAFLGDFGLVRAAEGSVALSTSSGGMIGTPAYMAPELWEGREVTAATDVYALSCVVVEMLTGRLLFDGSTPAVVMRQHLMEGPKFPEQWPGDVPAGVTEILQHGLNDDPAQRISRAGALAEGLTQSESDTSPAPVSAPDSDDEHTTKPRLTHDVVPLLLAGSDGQEVELTAPADLTLGRSPHCDISIKDGEASREHARLKFDGRRCLVFDLDSANGTFVNSRWVGAEGHPLNPGDKLSIGDTVFTLSLLKDKEPADEAAIPQPEPVSPPPAPVEVKPPAAPPPAPAGASTPPKRSGSKAVLVGCGLVLLVMVVGVVFGFFIWINNIGRTVPEPVVVTVEVERETVEVELEEVMAEEPEEPMEQEPTPEEEQLPGDEPEPLATEQIRVDTVINGEPTTLDPTFAADTTSTFLTGQMFVGLTALDQDGSVIPALARSWDVSEDGLIWTFNLRDDVRWVLRDYKTGKFDDVGPVTAPDVVYGVVRALDPRGGSDYAYVLSIIDGAEAYYTADPGGSDDLAALKSAVSVSAPDDYTVQFRLTAPAAYFPSIMSLWVTYPQPQWIVEQWGETWTEAGHIVTNGPYTLAEWAHGSELWLEKNPLWINADEVQIELFGGPIVEDASTAMAMYQNNQLDMMAEPGWSPPDLDYVRADTRLSQELVNSPRPCTYYYGFVNTKPPFDDVRVRKAFSAAIDRHALIENVVRGNQQPAHSLVPPGVFGSVAGNTNVAGYLVDGSGVDLAQQWLAEAGYPQGDGIDVTLMYNTSEGHANIADAIVEMWQAAFPRANITIEERGWATYLDTIRPDAPDSEKPHIFRLGWCVDYPDANNMLNEIFNSSSGQNYARYNNSDFDALVEQAVSRADPNLRQGLYSRAETLLIDQDAAIAPLYHFTSARLYKPWLSPVLKSYGSDPIAEWRIDWEAKQTAVGQ